MNHLPNDSKTLPTNDSDANRYQTDTASSPPPNWNYEATVAEVEAIINRIEMGDLDLAEVFDQFAIAVTHLHECETFLSQKKQQMDVLIETLTDHSEAF